MHADDYFVPDRAPPLDLSALPWPAGVQPPALASKLTDTNVPDAIDWGGLCSAMSRAASGPGIVIAEGFLLLSNSDAAGMLDAVIQLEAIGEEREAEMMRRKWVRAHLGEESYKFGPCRIPKP